MAQQSENIDEAEQGLRELSSYDDWNEPTVRTGADIHVHLDSHPDADEPPAKKLHAALVPLGIGLATGLVAAIVSAMQSCHR